MKPESIYQANYPGDAEFAIVDDVTTVNHKPHPFMIGMRHVAYAADHCGGRLGEEIARKFPCGQRGCHLSYDEHTSDRVAFIKLQRNVNQDEMRAWLVSLTEWCAKHKIDGFVFVENKGYRVNE